MKRILLILFAFLPLLVTAQMVQPVKWSGEEVGDSVRLKAEIEKGWHMTIIEFGEREYDEEFTDSFVVTLAKGELCPVRFNACDDKMCTAPRCGLSRVQTAPLTEYRILTKLQMTGGRCG